VADTKKERMVLLPNKFTPRHMRRGWVNRSGTVDQTKGKAFRRCKKISDRFIHQSSSALASPRLAHQYAEYCAVVDRSGLRKG
jgi:hypothetical protein